MSLAWALCSIGQTNSDASKYSQNMRFVKLSELSTFSAIKLLKGFNRREEVGEVITVPLF